MPSTPPLAGRRPRAHYPARLAAVAAAGLVAAAMSPVGLPGSAASAAGASASGAASAAGAARPAAPVHLTSRNRGSSVELFWEQPAGPRPVAFEVLEGKTVVARNDTTYVVIDNLPMGSSHTYTVRALDARGRTSPPSEPLTERVAPPRGVQLCANPQVTGLTATDVSATSLTLSWTDPYVTDPAYDLGGSRHYSVMSGSAVVASSLTGRAVHLSGLKPSTPVTLTVRTYGNCDGAIESAPLTVTTKEGAAPPAGAPGLVSLTDDTDSTLSLTWPKPTSNAIDHWAVYLDGRLAARTKDAATTSVTIGDLWWGDTYAVALVGVGAAGNETAPALLQTYLQSCRTTGIAAPRNVKVKAAGPSSAVVTWAQDSQPGSTSIKVDGTTELVVTSLGSTRLTGLSPGAHTVVVDPQMPIRAAACGDAPASAPVALTLPATPTARPAPATDLDYTLPFATSLISPAVLTWTVPAASTAVQWRVYDESGRKRASTKGRSATVKLQAGTTTILSVVGVDAAGAESLPTNQIAVRVSGPLVP